MDLGFILPLGFTNRSLLLAEQMVHKFGLQWVSPYPGKSLLENSGRDETGFKKCFGTGRDGIEIFENYWDGTGFNFFETLGTGRDGIEKKLKMPTPGTGHKAAKKKLKKFGVLSLNDRNFGNF